MKHAALIITLCFLAACGSAKQDDLPPPGPPPIDQTVFGPLIEQRDYAQQQAELLPKERKENLDKAIAADEQ
jgi:hypothetical protein